MSIRVSYYTITKGIYKYTKLIPIKAVKTVELYESSDAIDEDYEWLIRAFCSAQHKQKCTHTYTAGCISNLVFPIWTLNDTYVVHTNDNELCQRIFRPEPEPNYLKELVHEMRYNANLPGMLPTAIKQVEKEFNKKRKVI